MDGGRESQKMWQPMSTHVNGRKVRGSGIYSRAARVDHHRWEGERNEARDFINRRWDGEARSYGMMCKRLSHW